MNSVLSEWVEGDCVECGAVAAPINVLRGRTAVEVRCASCGHTACAPVEDVAAELATFEAAVDAAAVTPGRFLRGCARVLFAFVGGFVFGGTARA